MELGNPGDQRVWLTDLVLAGSKAATAGLLQLDYTDEGEKLEHVGERLVVLDNAGARACEIEITRLEQFPFAEVPWEFAEAEGEGFRSIEEWRDVHRQYWVGQGHEVDDSSTVVCLWFRLVGK